jgi:hypothetical protein
MRNSSTSCYATQQTNPFDLIRRVLASDLNPAAAKVLLVILDHAGHGKSVCTASTRTIAREARVTERHARRVILELQGRGLIMTDRATGSNHSRQTIRLGPCIHQVGRKVPLKLHEVGLSNQEVGHSEQPTRARELNLTTPENDGVSLDGEEIDPWTRLWFGAPPTVTNATVDICGPNDT